MFFLISYGLLNYATYWEARAASPSFRPRFRFFDRRLSLAGTLACLGAMLAINWVAGAGALLVLFVVYRYLVRRRTTERWADSVRSHLFQRAKESIRALSKEEEHARNWRPEIIAFSAEPTRRARLLHFASWLEGESGLTAAVHILEGEGALMRRERDRKQEDMQREVDELGLEVYARVILAADGIEALPVIVQSFGLGALRANTALFGWPENPDPVHRLIYVGALREIARLGVNIVAMSSDGPRWDTMAAQPARDRRIDVWWSDDDSSRLALLTAYLFTRTPQWSRAGIRVLAATSDDAIDETESQLAAMLNEARIAAEPVAVIDGDHDAVVATSADASLVFVPLRIRRDEILDAEGNDLDALLQQLPLAAGFLAGATVDLTAGPESGLYLTRAQAEARVEEAEARVKTLEHQLAAVDEEIAAHSAGSPPGDPDADERLATLERRRETVRRRTLKAEARAESALAELEALVRDRP